MLLVTFPFQERFSLFQIFRVFTAIFSTRVIIWVFSTPLYFANRILLKISIEYHCPYPSPIFSPVLHLFPLYRTIEHFHITLILPTISPIISPVYIFSLFLPLYRTIEHFNITYHLLVTNFKNFSQRYNEDQRSFHVSLRLEGAFVWLSISVKPMLTGIILHTDFKL